MVNDDDIEIIDCSLDDDVLGNITNVENEVEQPVLPEENVLKPEETLTEENMVEENTIKEDNENVFVNKMDEDVFENNNIFGVNTEYNANDVTDYTNSENVFVEPVINTNIFGEDTNTSYADNSDVSDEEALKQNAIQVFDMENDTLENGTPDVSIPKEEISEFNANVEGVQNVPTFENKTDSFSDFNANLSDIEEQPMIDNYNGFNNSTVKEVIGADAFSDKNILDDALVHTNNIDFDSEKPTVAPIEESDEKDSKTTVIFITIIFIILLIAVFLIPKIASLLT